MNPVQGRSGNPAAGAQFATPPSGLDQPSRIDDVWVRRTVCFPTADDPLSSAAALQDFVVIETGGENHPETIYRKPLTMNPTRSLSRELALVGAKCRDRVANMIPDL